MSLTLNGVEKSYGAQRVLRAISLAFAPASYVALLGPSGSGKSTLLRAIAGLIELDGGRIALEGEVLFDTARRVNLPPERRRLGMVFQSYAVWPHLSVLANVAYPLALAGLPTGERDARAKAALARVALTGFDARAPASLSGGQQQRVALARALAMEPRALLLDEPLANLDVHLRAELCDQFRAIHRAQGCAFVHVTHDREEALSLATEIVVLRDGAIEQVGTPEAVFHQPRTRFVAEFVAQAVSLPASPAQAPQGNRVRATALGSTITAEWRGPGEPQGDVWELAIPKDALLFPAPPGMDTLPATAGSTSYGGAHRQLAVQLGSVTARLQLPLAVTPPAPGAPIRVGVRSTWAFPASAT